MSPASKTSEVLTPELAFQAYFILKKIFCSAASQRGPSPASVFLPELKEAGINDQMLKAAGVIGIPEEEKSVQSTLAKLADIAQMRVPSQRQPIQSYAAPQ